MIVVEKSQCHSVANYAWVKAMVMEGSGRIRDQVIMVEWSEPYWLVGFLSEQGWLPLQDMQMC